MGRPLGGVESVDAHLLPSLRGILWVCDTDGDVFHVQI